MGAARSGALVAVLVPPPKSPRSILDVKGAADVDTAAIEAAQARAGNDRALDGTVEAVKKRTLRSSESVKAAVRKHRVALAVTTRSGVIGGNVVPLADDGSPLPASDAASGRAVSADDHSKVAVLKAASDAASGAESAKNKLAALGRLFIASIPEILKVALPAAVFIVAGWMAYKYSIGQYPFHRPPFLAKLNLGWEHHGLRICPVASPVKSGTTEAPCAKNLFQTAQVFTTLAAAAGGALVGLFAAPKTATDDAAAASGA